MKETAKSEEKRERQRKRNVCGRPTKRQKQGERETRVQRKAGAAKEKRRGTQIEE